MALNFPANPAVGDIFRSEGAAFQWTGTVWVSLGASPNLGVPTGTVAFFAGPTAPDGWLLCNNQRVSALYPQLRDYLLAAGSPFGMSGADPLVPDLRGEFIRGHIGGRTGIDDGRVFGSTQLDQLQRFSGNLNDIQTVGGAAQTVGIVRRNATTSSAIWQGATAVNRNTRFDIDTLLDPTVRSGSETRPRNVALLPCIKAFDAVDITGMADLAELLTAIATLAEVRAGISNEKLMTPANVRALSGSQLVTAPIALAGHTFTGIPDEATEIELLFEFLGSNAAAAHHIDVTLNGLIAGYTLFRVALANSVSVAAGDLVTTAFRCEVFANGLGLAGNLRLVRSPSRWIAEGKWRSFPNYVSVTGASPSLGAVNSIKLTPSVALAIGSASCRWRI